MNQKPVDPQARTHIGLDGKREIVRWRGKMEFTSHVKFNLLQRVKLLLGYEIDVHVVAITELTPGKYAPEVSVVLTAITNKQELVKTAKMKAAMAPNKGEVPKVPEAARKMAQ